MAAEFIDFKEIEKEAKRREKKAKRERRKQEIMMWIRDNKELAIIIIPAGLAAATALIKGGIHITRGVIRTHNLRKEEKIKNLYCYDRSLGHYWALRRELTNDEWVAIDKRKKAGERLADILDELKVLK